MSDVLAVTIDLTAAGLDLEPSELEARSLTLADELTAGKLAESARLARQSELSEGAKAGLLAFVGGVLTAEISRENLKKTMDFLGNQFYGKALTLNYKADGLECSLEYRNPEEMEQALAAVERLESIRIRVIEEVEK
ncbi:MAG: hypothetical protein WA783_10210 [Phormidesmis sp.]